MSKHGESLVKTCKESGITRSLFYEIRDGKRTVSDKVWRKLEAAERAFGIAPLGGTPAESSISPKQTGIGETAHLVRDDPVPYRTHAEPPERVQLSLDERIERLERIVDALADLLGNNRKPRNP